MKIPSEDYSPVGQGLLLDFYELTMAQGYFLQGRTQKAIFDLFFRKNAFSAGFTIFSGLAPLLKDLQVLQFSQDELQYLRSLGKFCEEFLQYLASFQFTGKIYAVTEGTVVFPYMPILTIEGSLIEAQLLEGRVLNLINYHSLIASKAAHIQNVIHYAEVHHNHPGSDFIEMGLRRAQSLGSSIWATRSAYIGGAMGTSNVAAAAVLDIPLIGTMAHSWVMAHESELVAFRNYATNYPERPVFLIDTYNTVTSGLKNAVKVGLEHKASGKGVIGVRLDSGDLTYLSKHVRWSLDQSGLQDAFIVVSNDLNEGIIEQMLHDAAPVDFWGVGTELVTGGSHSALGGVLKLAALESGEKSWLPTMKLSNQTSKTSIPGWKQVYRFRDAEGMLLGDLLVLRDENCASFERRERIRCHHPLDYYSSYELEKYKDYQPLLQLVWDGGPEAAEGDLFSIRKYTQEQLGCLLQTYKRLLNPHIYKVSLSTPLRDMRHDVIRKISCEQEKSHLL